MEGHQVDYDGRGQIDQLLAGTAGYNNLTKFRDTRLPVDAYRWDTLIKMRAIASEKGSFGKETDQNVMRVEEYLYTESQPH